MKVLITTLNSKYIHSSLSVRYLKSFCENAATNIDFVVQEYTINQNSDFIAGEIFKENADVVAFSCYIWNIDSTLEIAKTLKIVKPDIKIVLGGPEVSFDGKELLVENDSIDYIIYGEGEVTFRELIINLSKRELDLSHIDGLIYRGDGKVYENPPRPLICNLDDIPSPFLSDLEEFENKIVYYESSRGCPFNCRFCLSSTIQGVRFFSLERVKDDLKRLIKAGVKQVKFVDRTFNAKKEYAFEIMNFIINETKGCRGDINFHFEVTAHLLDDEILNFLKEAPEGLFQFEIGVQSTNLETIKAINRSTDIDKLRQVIKKIRGFRNIHQHLDLIAGLPYEDYDTFKKSFNDVYNMQPDKLQLGFLKLLKGSELRSSKEKYGFKYLDKPPYEVLENNYISYKEMLRLKIIEDLVERYGNEGNFKNSIDFIIKNHYKSPFDFYEDFSIYWETRKYHTRSHSKKNLYELLYSFYNEKAVDIDKAKAFKEILKYDFLFNNKNTNIPKYMKGNENINIQKIRHKFLQIQDNIDKYLPDYRGISTKDIIKELHFEEFSLDIYSYIKGEVDFNEALGRNTIIMFVYDTNKPLNKCKTVDVSRDFYKIVDKE